MAIVYFNYGVLLQRAGNEQEARQILLKAADEFREKLKDKKDSAELWNLLGDTLAFAGDFKAAADAFKHALQLEPNHFVFYDSLVKALEYNEQYEEAIKVTNEQIQRLIFRGQSKDAEKLRKYIDTLQTKKQK